MNDRDPFRSLDLTPLGRGYDFYTALPSLFFSGSFLFLASSLRPSVIWAGHTMYLFSHDLFRNRNRLLDIGSVEGGSLDFS